MKPCRITVLKRTINQDLVAEYLNRETDFGKNFGVCEAFADGQKFEVAAPFQVPDGFCAWAWADLRHDLLSLAIGADLPWIRQSGVAIVGCTDWLRPVYFKLERLDR
jgi:uncharacterized repeat protein (TIGR04076 family)